MADSGDSGAAEASAAAASTHAARRRGAASPLATMQRDLRALSADLSRLANGGLEDELPPSSAESDEGVTSASASEGSARRKGGTSSTDAGFPASSGDESYKQAGLKAIDELQQSLSSGLSSLLGTSAWPASWSWTEGAAAPSGASAPAGSAVVAAATQPQRAAGPHAVQQSAEASEAHMTTISLDNEAPAGSAAGQAASPPTASAPPACASTASTDTVLGASFEQGGLLLEAVGRTAMSMIAPQCPCPTPGGGVTLFAGDAWEEADDEDERARSGALQAGETPTFERAFSAAGGQQRIDELEELSTAAAQAAIRARACMLQVDRTGYDQTLDDVRAALGSCEESIAAEGPPPQLPTPCDPAHVLVLQQAVVEANARAAAVVASAVSSFDAELTAAEADANAVACAVPASRSDDARSWRGCEVVAAQALERLHNRGIRRVGEASAAALKHMGELAASVTEREARLPGAGGALWPSSASEKAVFVATRALALNASVHLLADAFGSGIDRVVQHVSLAGLDEPAKRMQQQGVTYKSALHAASRASAVHLSRALRHFTYVLTSAHLAVALERSMSGTQPDAGR